MAKIQSGKTVEIKISTIVAVSAILHGTDPALLDQAMREMTGGEADYFDGECAVIDLGNCDPAPGSIDWAGLIRMFNTYRLNPVAVRHAAPELIAEIQAHGLSLDVVAKPRPAPDLVQQAELLVAEPAPAAVVEAAPVSNTGLPTMIIDTPVRAGQRIYARGADLVVTAVVNNGAELIADGSIHVYAPLRGRALAGANGNAEARIFTLSMEAELVSIAGMYRTFDTILTPDLARQAVQVRLVGDRIDVLPLNPGARTA